MICNLCNGKGVNIIINQIGPGMIQQSQSTCNKCRGKGETVKNKCNKCNGSTMLDEECSEDIKIEKHMNNDDQIKIINKGHQPSESGEKGDLIVFLKIIKHQVFDRKGTHLYCTIPISLGKALCGGQIVVNHLDNHQILVNLSDIVYPNKTYRIANEGMFNVNGYDRGDLIIKFDILFPKSLDDLTKTKLKQLLNYKCDNKKNILGSNYYETDLVEYTQTDQINENHKQNNNESNNENGIQCQQQ